MNSNSFKPANLDARSSGRVGLTLAELLVSVVASTFLMAGISSAVLLVTRAAQMESPGETIQMGLPISDLSAELSVALSFRERSAHAVEFAVADRDGDGQPEWIRYAWSGAIGDPLTRQLNGGSSIKVLENIHDFTLNFVVDRGDEQESLRVLLVVPDSANLNNQDAAKKSCLESLGHTVQTITATLPQTAFDAAEASNDTAYISEETYSYDLNTKLRNAGMGVLNEERVLYDDFGIASDSVSHYGTRITVTNNTHQITTPFSMGNLPICDSSEELVTGSGTMASGIIALCEQQSSNRPLLMTLEAGQPLYDGGSAAGRRVMLPWGGGNFNFLSLNQNARTLLGRALSWAAGDVLSEVELSVQMGPSRDDSIELRTAILNQPRVSGK